MKTPVLKCKCGAEVREDNTEVWHDGKHAYWGVLCPKCSMALKAYRLN
jgi:hypothetical protein